LFEALGQFETEEKVREVYGDKAYVRKSILSQIEEVKAKAFITVSATVYQLDESEYSYNKNSDEMQPRVYNGGV
jgi:hypothetical protein